MGWFGNFSGEVIPARAEKARIMKMFKSRATSKILELGLGPVNLR